MSRLVIVSNRVADLKTGTQSGGLAVALADALKERGGIWFGWDGADDGVTGAAPQVETIGNVVRIAAPLSAEDLANYYLGYANSVLWPMFHYRLDLVDYRPEFSESYWRVNETFARQLNGFLRPDDIVWIHDYHLIPLASCLRTMGCKQKIGFFLHIPFPPSDLFSAAPEHTRLVEALLQFDLIGFQTQTDVNNLKHYLTESTGAVQHGDNEFVVDGRSVLIDRFPIGIDAASFAEMATDSNDEVEMDLMRLKVLGRRQIIGVDRLDYSKGLPERFKAFGRLVEQHPELSKKVSFLQVASPTREAVDAYADIRTELETLAGSINGKFADFNWTPLRYINRAVAREILAPLFRGSQVGFVTPLRDGMNLVAKEYIAAQRPNDPGVLVLSQFAGAAEELTEALIVNPYDIDEMARQLHRALVMPLEERRERHSALRRKVFQDDARSWLNNFMAVLEQAGGGSNDEPARSSDEIAPRSQRAGTP
ncbi:alpha,alpha-trehalose-phosphate synthase (UDP-forming) [Aquamicrobium zhengzhouense]|uniref:Trehalose-6-phosphate synthase n=1 Tax=Aquamicrobium zhengzhouense TaxID=2781738 RepID=A0ABS0SD23_9HYPH|nr:trehalose-6-phosphate synthase [Aquamicrobium zhengzhouense]MBI1621199.1 trehalose-6-phosphate synthase [Aquamicrobium zhengzhouense]